MDYKDPNVTIGAKGYSKYPREANDYYKTDPIAIRLLEKHNLLIDDYYWECACGDGALSKELIRQGYNVYSSDLFDRGYGDAVGVDFLKQKEKFNGSIITNPPFSLLEKFVLKGLELAKNRLYIFARINTLESQKRYDSIFKNNPPIYVCQFVRRIKCYRTSAPTPKYSAISYAWFIWDNNDNTGETKIKWLI